MALHRPIAEIGVFALAGMPDRLAGDSHLWNTGFQLGDWLDPTAPPEDPTQAMTDPHLVGSAYFAWSDRRLAKSAAVLGKRRRRAALAGAIPFCGQSLRPGVHPQ
jgi:hypothetical protein